MGYDYLVKKREFLRQLRARRAAEIANSGGLGTVKLPSIRRKLRGRLLCSEKLQKGTPIVLTVKDHEVVGLRENVPMLVFDEVAKATLGRLRRQHFAIGHVTHMHHFMPLVDVSVELGGSDEKADARDKANPVLSAK